MTLIIRTVFVATQFAQAGRNSPNCACSDTRAWSKDLQHGKATDQHQLGIAEASATNQSIPEENPRACLFVRDCSFDFDLQSYPLRCFIKRIGYCTEPFKVGFSKAFCGPRNEYCVLKSDRPLHGNSYWSSPSIVSHECDATAIDDALCWINKRQEELFTVGFGTEQGMAICLQISFGNGFCLKALRSGNQALQHHFCVTLPTRVLNGDQSPLRSQSKTRLATE
jgi:hypothetical protein